MQLVIFWVATTWLAAGIYIVPKVLGKEPKKQGVLVDILFWALIIVVMGSMIGEWGHILGWIDSHWWLFGHFGWEYIELGKFWQILFIVGNDLMGYHSLSRVFTSYSQQSTSES